jgi:DNA invertase Pin-like site-specific DNA recombinase
MRHTAIYARVSGRAQELASQLPDLERWEKTCPGPVTMYTDKVTGKTMDRPGWSKLARALAAGELARIVVWRLDRLGRTASGLTALFDELRARKVDLVSLKDGFDLRTPAGTLMAGILASVAQYETEVRAERVRAGLDVAKTKGVKLGRPKGGSKKGVAKRTKVTPDHERQVRRMRDEGEGVSAIARVTGLSRMHVYRLLKEGRADA